MARSRSLFIFITTLWPLYTEHPIYFQGHMVEVKVNLIKATTNNISFLVHNINIQVIGHIFKFNIEGMHPLCGALVIIIITTLSFIKMLNMFPNFACCRFVVHGNLSVSYILSQNVLVFTYIFYKLLWLILTFALI